MLSRFVFQTVSRFKNVVIRLAEDESTMRKQGRSTGVQSIGYLVAFLIAAPVVFGGDWSQILGPTRNGVADEEKLADKWPETGPATVWEAKVGSGFAGPAVSGDILILFHRKGSNDTLTAYNFASGKELWARPFRTDFRPEIVNDDGPRAVPTIHGDRVYALAANGGLYCVDLKTGEPIWERQIQREFQAPAGYFGSGSSPLVEGKQLIVNVGGDRAGAGIVAFDLAKGDTVWKSVSDQASYSSPVAVTVDGTRHLLCLTRLNFVSLDPRTGKENFRTPFGQRGPTVNAAIPVLFKNQVLLTASYGIGAELVTIRDNKMTIDWNDDVLSSQYTTPILDKGAIYGIDGRQDQGEVTLVCFDLLTKKVHWTEPAEAYATLIAADGKLVVMQTNGKVKLVALKTAGYQELAAATLLPGTTRALPALSAGRLYVRNERQLKCVSVAP